MAACRLLSFACASAIAGPAIAGYNPALVEVADDPDNWVFATKTDSLDALSTGYQWPMNSGFAWYSGGVAIDETQLVSESYLITAPQTVGVGGDQIDLVAGDRVFAYRIRLVTSTPASSVTSLSEFQALGTSFLPGSDVMPASFINGQGFVTTGHGNDPLATNLDGDDLLGSGVDFEWEGSDAGNLDNDNEITLLIFAQASTVGTGLADLRAPSGQPGGLTGTLGFGEQPPVLIPIVPSPGAIALTGIAALGAVVRRRR